MKRVLLTGGSGFIGANLTRRLVADGHEVHLLLRRDHDPWRLAAIRQDIHRVDGDVTDERALTGAVAVARPDWVFHLAAYGAYPAQTDPRQAARTNVDGTIGLLEAAAGRGFEAFVHAGSSSEYGIKDHAPREDEPAVPNSAYAATKVAATTYCSYVARRDRSRVTTLRLYSAYGPFEEPSRLFPTLIVHALDGRLPPLAQPDIARDYVAVGDVCDAFILAAERGPLGGSVYNVATGRQTSLAELVEIVRRTFGVTQGPVWGSFPDRAWDTNVWIGDATRIRHELGWAPRTALADALPAMADWLRADPTVLARYRAATASRALAAETTRLT